MSEEIIKQWDNAAETFAKEQECSAFADANKKIIKKDSTHLTARKS
jgi:hypothetical protein